MDFHRTTEGKFIPHHIQPTSKGVQCMSCGLLVPAKEIETLQIKTGPDEQFVENLLVCRGCYEAVSKPASIPRLSDTHSSLDDDPREALQLIAGRIEEDFVE